MSNQEKTFNITTNEREIIVREGRAPEVFQYNGFQYRADSTPALIALVKSKAVKENCVIAYTETGFKVILDDTVTNRRQDRVDYSFKNSLQYDEWKDILESGLMFNQKQFIDFLRRREPGEVEDIDSLIASIQNFKYAQNITGDFTFDDRNNYTFAFKIGDAEGTIRLPQYLYVNIEIYKESGFIQKVELELEVQKPKSEGEKLLFALTCPKLQRYQKLAVENEIDTVKNELDDYLIVAGGI